MAEKKKNNSAGTKSTAVTKPAGTPPSGVSNKESKPGATGELVPGTEVLAAPPAIIETEKFGLELRTLDDMYRFSQYLVKGGMVPETDTPETCVIKLQYGAELGLRPMASIQNIAVINRRPVLWGDAVPAIVHGSGLMLDYREEEIGVRFQDDYGWKITSVRKGAAVPMVTIFTVADAKTAGLWGSAKRPPWIQYPSRMLKMRARTFNLRDNFPDVLRGISTGEEVEDATFEVVDEEKPGDRTQGLNKQMGAVIEQDSAPSAPEEPAGAPTPAAEEDKALAEKVRDTVEKGLPFEQAAPEEAPQGETEETEAGTRLYDDLRVVLRDVSTPEEMQEFKQKQLATSVSRLLPAHLKRLVALCKEKEDALKVASA